MNVNRLRLLQVFRVFYALLVTGLGEVKYHRKGHHKYALRHGPYFFLRKVDISWAREKS